VSAIFNLGSGTVGTTGDTGGFTLDAATIEDVGDGWYRCTMAFTSDDDDSLSLQVALLTGAGSTTIPIGDSLILAAPVMLLQSSPTTAYEYPVTNHSGNGPMVQVRIGWDLDTTETTGQRSGWKHAATRNQFRSFSRYSFYHRFTSRRFESDIWLELWDPNNALGYIEAGRLIVGRAEDFEGNLDTYSNSSEELGGQQEADGGQIYRQQRPIRRRWRASFRCLTERQAFDQIDYIQNTFGRSRQILVIGEPSEASVYQQQHLAYGFIENLSDIPLQRGGYYTWDFDVVQTP
jgi:hypothetical protein